MLGLALAAALWTTLGVADAERAAVRSEVTNALIGMSWLPLLALAGGAWAGLLVLRKRPAPLSGSWAVDLPLFVAAAAFGLRAYAVFTPEGSYAPYYAAPLVLLLVIGHHRLAHRRPQARAVTLAVPALVALALAAYSVHGLYSDDDTTVHTPRGSYVTDASAAAATQPAVDAVVSGSAPGDRILAAPGDGGLYFMTNRRPALYELMLLPGLLDTTADEREAIRRLRLTHTHIALIGARDLSDYGSSRFGRDYVTTLGRYLDAATVRRSTLGDLDDRVAGTHASRGYELLELR